MAKRSIELGLPFAIALLLCAACNDERRYVGDPGVTQVAITEQTPPAFEAEDTQFFVVEQRIELPVLPPSDTALADLQTAASNFDGLPFPRMPWIERDDLAI